MRGRQQRRMTTKAPVFDCRLVRDEADLRAAQRLRYIVFVEELGGDGPLVDHAARLERDRFDPFFDHLILTDARRPEGDHVVGVYRVMTTDAARSAGQFYSEEEYDLAPLRRSGRPLLELGRSCVHPDYRGGTAVPELWSGLAAYVAERKIEVLFGVASFHGTDVAALAQPLSFLHQNYLAPEDLRVRARGPNARSMDLMPARQVDRKTAMLAMPPLIKGYLRLGGLVGEGAWIDQDFMTTDVCLIMDTARLTNRAAALYNSGPAAP